MWTIAALALLLPPIVLAVLLAFGTRKPPPPVSAVVTPPAGDLPVPTSIAARDGTRLALRHYPARNGADGRVAIVIHGSAATGAAMHGLASALSGAGIAACVPDIRGHGGSGARGDIAYPGQLDDDLADVVTAIRATYPDAPLSLIGFSLGGGFALRIAASPLGRLFTQAVLVAPMLGRDAPTVRPSLDGMARYHGPRIAALSVLNHMGIHRFDGLPALVISEVADTADPPTSVYSFRLMQNFATRDYADDLRYAQCPLAVVVGADDKIFDAAAFAPAIETQRADVPVTVVAGIGHVEMTTDPRGLAAIIAAIPEESDHKP